MGQDPFSLFDEMTGPDGRVRDPYQAFEAWLKTIPTDQLQQKRQEADMLFRRMGITFLVYFEGGSDERLIPFDILPRILSAAEWGNLEAGAIQRVRALNAFLHDVYHEREICKAGVVPEELILTNAAYRPEAFGLDLPHRVYAHIAGIDIVRVGESDFYVLEDNLRTPSGVSYMLEDREVMTRLFPELFERMAVAPVDNYPDCLLNALRSVAPAGRDNPRVVLMTPGRFNSAYFEHVFLSE
ncbi:MAG: circularly permuted type 2 ATP-grasp protein, partial [bacterium]|nr:circularly permuted type 2 ATP-grasp protein [bacterium]